MRASQSSKARRVRGAAETDPPVRSPDAVLMCPERKLGEFIEIQSKLHKIQKRAEGPQDRLGE